MNWTPEARALLETWLAPRAAAAADDGAAAGEVADGLRAHVHEELLRRGVERVDETELSSVLAAIDAPVRMPERRQVGVRSGHEGGAGKPGGSRPPALPRAGFRWPWVFLFFGVVLPALTWAGEWALGMCASEFFDPLPTLWHVGLVGLVPVALWFVYRTIQRQDGGRVGWAAGCAGVALAIAVFYSLAFGRMLGLAVIAGMLCLVMPWWLPLPLMTLAAPLAGLTALWGWHRLRRMGPCFRPWVAGAGLGALLLLAGEAPRWAALSAMHTAATASEESARSEAVARLRRLPGARAMVHDACFGEGRNRGGAIDITSWMARGVDSMAGTRFAPEVTMDQARTLHYRMTGLAFTEVKPRSARRTDVFNMRLGVGRAARTDWVWDGERGGTAVGARLPGLSVASSRMEWHADPTARLGYGEWTLEFANDHANEQEARAQIQLPPGACVSRLTLWVHGEPQEAAFAGQSAVRAAYQKVVTVEQRDPVLVTQVGPDVVMMQCFPVPRNGGRMKLRLGITAPFDAQGRLWLPQFIERNFSLPESLRHVVWMQSRGAFEAHPAGTIEKTDTGAQTWQQDVPTSALGGAKFVWPAADTGPVWCENGLAAPAEPRFVTGQWKAPPAAPPSAVAVVVDGSLSLRPLRRAIAEALRSDTRGVSVAAWISTDSDPRALDLAQPEAGLTDNDFAGGRDSLGALRAALSWARGQPGTATVLWLHGPQPTELGDPAALEQLLQFTLRHVPIVDVPLVPGAHRLTEKLYRRSDLRGAPRLPDPAASLPALFADLLSGRGAPVLAIARQADAPTTGTQTSDQLARYAAFLETMDAFRGHAVVPEEVVASAARHQVVTPVTGAVVLETKRQYEESGLSQVDPSSVPKVPTIPEPGTVMLLLASAVVVLRRRRAGG
jgi:hypothetical protein